MLHVEVLDAVLVLTLDRPAVRNAIDAATSAAIEAAIDRLESDDGLRCAVLAHTGPVFCAGADLKALVAQGLRGIETERGGFAGLCRRARQKPLVVAVDGPAVGGGLEIVLAADVVVASDAASFAVPEVRRGLVALSGGTFRLARAVGRAVALDLAMTGEPLDAARGAQLGLVSRLVPAGTARSHAISVATTIAANAPVAVRESRALVRAAADHDEAELWRLAEASARRVLDTEDAREGPRAFAEKRAPRWLGR
jgi:enoyl-CoA hydratase